MRWTTEACKSCGILVQDYLEEGQSLDDWYCISCWRVVERMRLRDDVARLKAFVGSLRRFHERHCESRLVDACNCGAKEFNAKLDKVLACGSIKCGS